MDIHYTNALRVAHRILRKIKIALASPLLSGKLMLAKCGVSQLTKVVIENEVFYEYKGTLYPDYLTKGNACGYITSEAKQFCTGKGIDVGASIWPLEGAIPVVSEKHQNAYLLGAFADDSLDYVFSSHCLEHLTRWKQALRLWISKLKPGGILFLYLPHESMLLWRPGGLWCGLEHKWSPNYERIATVLRASGMEIVTYNAGRDGFWSFHVVARKGQSNSICASMA